MCVGQKKELDFPIPLFLLFSTLFHRLFQRKNIAAILKIPFWIKGKFTFHSFRSPYFYYYDIYIPSILLSALRANAGSEAKKGTNYEGYF